jgi:hypothetical protein
MRPMTWKHLVLGTLLVLGVITVVIAILSATGGGGSERRDSASSVQVE